MIAGITGLDHAVLLVRDLDLAVQTYERLGFTATPRGFHSLGSQNHCLMFARDYLELMALPRPVPAFQFFIDFLQDGEGVGAVALASEDAALAQRALREAGMPAEPPLALARPVEDLGEARFTLVQLPPAATPGFRSFVCQHHTRDMVWRPEYAAHPNGAQALCEVICAGKAGDYLPLFDGVPLRVCSREEAEGRFPGLLAPREGPCIVALRIAVRALDETARELARRAVRHGRLAGGEIAVAAPDAHGVALIFCPSGL